jgi:hypothetical protein
VTFALHDQATKATVAGMMAESRNVDGAARIGLFECLLGEFS